MISTHSTSNIHFLTIFPLFVYVQSLKNLLIEVVDTVVLVSSVNGGIVGVGGGVPGSSNIDSYVLFLYLSNSTKIEK